MLKIKITMNISDKIKNHSSKELSINRIIKLSIGISKCNK